MKSILFFCFLLAYATNSIGQFNLNKLKDIKIDPTKGKDVLGDINDKTGGLSEKIAGKLKKNKDEEYEKINFNYAIAFSDVAGLFEVKEKFARQKTLLSGAVNSLDDSKESKSEKAEGFNATGEMFYANNKFKSSRAAYLKAIKLYSEDGKTNTEEFANVLNNLGLLYHTTGRYTVAEEQYKKALAIREKTPTTSAYGNSINNLAVLYKDLGKYNQSEKLIDQAISVGKSNKEQDALPYALSLNNKAMLFQDLGRLEEAESLMKECIEIAKNEVKEGSASFIKLKINLAILYRLQEKYSKAEEIYLTAMKDKKKRFGAGHPDYAHLESGLAALYIQKGEMEKAEPLLQNAADAYRKKLGEESPAYATGINELGNFYAKQQKWAKANPLLKQAKELRKKLLGESHPDYINALEDYATVQWKVDSTSTAAKAYNHVITTTLTYIDEYFAPMSEREKTKFWDQLRPRINTFNAFAVSAKKSNPELLTLMYENQLKTKALLLTSTSKMRSQIMSSKNAQLKKDYLEWLDTKESLARYYTLSKEELEEESINLDSLEEISNQLERQLSEQSEEFSKGVKQQDITLQKITAALQPNEANVEIIQYVVPETDTTGKVYYAALVVNSTLKQPLLAVFENGNSMEGEWFSEYRSLTLDGFKDPNSYQRYWSKIAPLVQEQKKLYVSLDGIYTQISINTLQGENKKYLFDEKEIEYLTNSKEILELKQGKKKPSAATASLYGFPNYGSQDAISPLPGTEQEVNKINATLKDKYYTTTTFLQNEATETNVKKANAGIIHIATHGYFLPSVDKFKTDKALGIDINQAKANPLHRSGLLLAGAESTLLGEQTDAADNGVLTSYEIMNMSLDKTNLVVLSACETGRGDVKSGEGVYGLQRAFQVAGANCVIMSLWYVDDDATRDLMIAFYKNLNKDLSNKQQALRTAQQTVKDKYGYPYYWGAFVMMGS